MYKETTINVTALKNQTSFSVIVIVSVGQLFTFMLVFERVRQIFAHQSKSINKIKNNNVKW